MFVVEGWVGGFCRVGGGVEKSKAYYPRTWRWVAYTSLMPPTVMNKPGESWATESRHSSPAASIYQQTTYNQNKISYILNITFNLINKEILKFIYYFVNNYFYKFINNACWVASSKLLWWKKLYFSYKNLCRFFSGRIR